MLRKFEIRRAAGRSGGRNDTDRNEKNLRFGPHAFRFRPFGSGVPASGFVLPASCFRLRASGPGLAAYWCCSRSRSWTTFTGEKVVMGTSTKTVFHLAMAPFHSPGSSCARRSRPPADFDEMKPVAGSV